MEFDGTEYNGCCNKCFPDRENFSVIIQIPALINGKECNPKCALYQLNSLYVAHCSLGLAKNISISKKLSPGKRCPRYNK